MTDLTACLRRGCARRLSCLRYRMVHGDGQITQYDVGPRYECHMPIRPGARVEPERLCDLRADPDAKALVEFSRASMMEADTDGVAPVETVLIGGMR